MRHLVLVALLGLTIPGRGQSVTVNNYNVAEGLPSSEVYDIFQDSKGFLWVATDNGVSKYDGYQFRNYNVADGLPDPVVFETLEDPQGKIWFRTFSGRVAYVENEKIYQYKFNDQLSSLCEKLFLASLTFDQAGTLWFTAFSNWGSIDTTGIVTVHEINKSSVYYKTVEKSSILGYKGGEPGLTKLYIDDQGFSIELSHHWNNPKISHTVKRSIIWRGILYISINNNIFKYDGKSVARAYVGSSAIISLSKDKNDNLWIGLFHGGSIRFSDKELKHDWIPSFTLKNSITDVLEDNEGGLWFSSLENGIFYVPNLEIEHHFLPSTSKIKSVLASPSFTAIGEIDGTLTLLENETFKIIKAKKFNQSVLALFSTKDRLWASTGGLLYILDQNMVEQKSSIGNFVGFFEDGLRNILAVESVGISKFDTLGNLIYNKFKRSPHRTILAMDSLIIVGLHTGLNVYDKELNLINSPKKLKNIKVSGVYELTDSILLVATIGSGFMVTTRNFDEFKTYQTHSKNIYDVILADSMVWLGTENGILKIPLHSLITNNISYDFITKKSGLLSNQITHLAKTNHAILAFYDNAYSVIHNFASTFVNNSPDFYLKGIQINNKITDIKSFFNLPYDKNNVRLEFGFIGFKNQNISIRYRINKQNSWIYLTERSLNLYSLSPKKYKLEIQYSLDKIHWINAPSIPIIQISPPWWETIGFRLVVILIILLMSYLFYNNRLVIYRQRSEKLKILNEYQESLIRAQIETLEKERSRIAQDLHDTIGPNILATKLIVGSLLRKINDPQVEVIEGQLQHTIHEIKEIIYDLSPPGLERYGLVTGLKNYIDRLLLSTTFTINFNSFGKEVTDPNIRVNAFRILQELLTNSIKHSHAKVISIHLNSFYDFLNIVYEDNGIGFNMTENNKGLGLHSITSRIKTVNGILRFESGPFGVSYSIDIPLINTG